MLSRAPGTRLELEPKAPRLRNLAGKRLSEVLISSFGLIVVLPVFAICSLLIKIFCGPGPVFSREVRLGTDGDYFLLMRFRTSCAVGVSPLSEIAGESLFDLYYPRFRRFLKHFSLDEIPQFLNVVRGEMSLVGPRPKPLRIMEYPSDLDPYPMQNVKPGIVSWETLVNDREEGRRLDIDYATAWSPRKMTHALLRTCYFGLFNRPL